MISASQSFFGNGGHQFQNKQKKYWESYTNVSECLAEKGKWKKWKNGGKKKKKEKKRKGQMKEKWYQKLKNMNMK